MNRWDGCGLKVFDSASVTTITRSLSSPIASSVQHRFAVPKVRHALTVFYAVGFGFICRGKIGQQLHSDKISLAELAAISQHHLLPSRTSFSWNQPAALHPQREFSEPLIHHFSHLGRQGDTKDELPQAPHPLSLLPPNPKQNRSSKKRKRTFRFPPVIVTFTNRRVYVILFFARPLGVFFFSCGSTLGVCDLTFPARAREPWWLMSVSIPLPYFH